jgi:hypothetical protein
LGAIICRHFEKSRFHRSKVRIANPQISRGSGAHEGVRQTGHSKASSAMAIAAAFFQRSYPDREGTQRTI